MDRFRKTAILLALFSLPAFAHSALTTPEPLCFASGPVTYRLAPASALPDFKVRVDNAKPRPDLRMQMVSQPEIADFVIADDYSTKDMSACRTSSTVKTVKVDSKAEAPDVTIALTADGTGADYKVYVQSVRYSHQDKAALLAVVWKAEQTRRLVERR
jgi:hypothetical protein